MYSDCQKFIVANIAALVLFDTPIMEGNRTYVGSLKFDLPIEGTGSQVIKGIRLLNWQIEDLVKNMSLSSDNQLSRLLNPNIFGQSECEIVVHTRTVGGTYVNLRTGKDFVVKETDSKIKHGDKVYSVELGENSPIILSQDAQSYLRKLSLEADVEEQRELIKKASSSFADRRTKRLADLAKKNAMQNPDQNPDQKSNQKSNHEQDPVLALELEKLLAVETPTVRQKNRIAELQVLLGAE